MIEYLIKILDTIGFNEITSLYLANIIAILSIFSICIIVKLILDKIFLKYLTKLIKNNNIKWDNVLLERKVFERLFHIAPAIIIYYFAPIFPSYQLVIQNMVKLYFIIIIISVLSALIDSLYDVYNTLEQSKNKSIKGLMQVLKIILYSIGIIIIISNLINESPIYLLSSLGALAAVLSLVFKDTILGFVAGVQMAANDMVRLGDWIEMPKYQADGMVMEITLNTIKVRNFDSTITTIPSYALVSDSFKNWRGMFESGGRRIKRSIYIDVNSIKFCDQKQLNKFKKIHYLKDYIEHKEQDIKDYHDKNNIDTSVITNSRKLTNIGTFRMYITEYLKNHPNIHQEKTIMVRQLPLEKHGLPIEIYAFANDVVWVNYEGIQSDIFDHIISIAPEFDLKLFQEPSGNDFKDE